MESRNHTTTTTRSMRPQPSAPPLPRKTLPGFSDICAFLLICFIGCAVCFVGCSFALLAVRLLQRSNSSDDFIPLRFQVQSVTTPTPFTLNTTTPSAATITAAFNITFSIDHPNYGALYGPANVSVYYHHQPHPYDLEKAVVEYYLSSSSLESLCPDRGSCDLYDVQSRVSVTVPASSVPVLDDLIEFLINQDLNQHGEFGITVKISADYWLVHENKDAELRVICEDVKIGVLTGVMVNQPSQCNVALH